MRDCGELKRTSLQDRRATLRDSSVCTAKKRGQEADSLEGLEEDVSGSRKGQGQKQVKKKKNHIQHHI